MSGRIFDKVLDKIVRHGRLEVIHADGRRAAFGTPADGFPNVTIRLGDRKVSREILLEPDIGSAETFMDGRLLIERGDIMQFIQLIRANQPWERHGRLPKPSLLRRVRKKLGFAVTSFNRATGARRNISHHYDIGNDLYRLMLDQPYMQYSCAYWPRDGMTLEEAQKAKLAHIAAKLALAPGQRVLDIGCGWGGMAIFLAQHHDIKVLGITLSQEQLELARENAEAAGVSDKVSFELIDYRDLMRRKERFDRIVSVGMFEHVGQPQFETFFRCAANLLVEDGVMLLHTIGRMGSPGATDRFTSKYIFPGGYIPALSETLEASEKSRLIAADIETLRLHYAKTLREWYARCIANQDAIVSMMGERFFRMWTFYLSGSTAAFESGGMCNYQIQYTRSRRALPLSRDYMAEAEQQITGNVTSEAKHSPVALQTEQETAPT